MSYNQEYGREGGSNSGYYEQNAQYGDEPRRGNDEYNDTRYTGPGNYSGGDDFSSAAHHAEQHHSSEDRGLFDNALGFLNQRKGELSHPDNIQVDEEHAMKAHQALYNGDGGEHHDDKSIGSGAAVQALKMFTSGGSSDGGFDQNKLIGLAMAQAGKLWDEKQSSGANVVSLFFFFFFFLILFVIPGN